MKISRTMLSILLAIIITSVIAIAGSGLKDDIQRSDVAIILGSKANPDGTPSPRLAARLDKGVELYQQGMFKHIIVTGGTGVEGVDEALVMKNYLLAHHVPASAIIMDSAGSNTEASARNSKQIMLQNHFESALIISQYFHIKRTELLMRRYHVVPVYHAHADFFEVRDLFSVPREVIAYYYYMFV